MINQGNGASVGRRGAYPALHLQPLMACLAQAIPPSPPIPKPSEDKKDPLQRPLLQYSSKQQAILINTTAVLSRLSQSAHFRHLKPDSGDESTKGSGFLQDVEVPAYGQMWLGGFIPEGTEKALTADTLALENAIFEEITRLCEKHGLDLHQFHLSSLRERLERLANKLNVSFNVFESQTPLVPMVLEEAASQSKIRSTDLARMISSKEEWMGDKVEHLRQLKSALRRMLEHRGHLEGYDIDEIMEHVERQAALPGSQLHAFLVFLECDALARLRLAVTFKVMNALASDAAIRPKQAPEDRLFGDYVRRATALYEWLSSPASEDLEVGMAVHFSEGNFLLNKEMLKVTFYNCLSVWCEWNAQIFESDQPVPEGGNRIIREISYRFRINGQNPEQGKRAFPARLDKIREALLPVEDDPRFVQRNLSELLVLAVLITEDPVPKERPDVQDRLRKLIDYLQKRGRDGVRIIVDELEARAAIYCSIAEGLIKTLRSSGALFQEMFQQAWDFHLNITRGLVDLDSLMSLREDFLNCDHRRSQSHFFDFLEIQEGARTTSSLFSIPVRVSLSEYSLRPTAESYLLEVQREVPEHLVQVFWKQFHLQNEEFQPNRGDQELWRLGPFLMVEYSDRYLQRGPTDEKHRQLLAAYRSAFTILVYMTLRSLVKKITHPSEGLPYVLMMRMQDEGKTGTGQDTAAELVYAASHAIEFALGREMRCKLQGLAYDKDPHVMKYKHQNVYSALNSLYPIVLRPRLTPTLDKVGVIAFSARPCDSNPDTKQDADGYILLMKTYLQERTPDANLRFFLDRIQTAMGHSRQAFEQPSLVAEEIDRLQRQGCFHIFYMAHQIGDRRLGRSATHQRFHDNPIFLNQIAQDFPDVTLFPIVRDVFPATRLQETKRGKHAKGFEIEGYEGHRLKGSYNDLYANFIPIYTLATLVVVGKNEAQRPQSGFSTYFLLHDQSNSDRLRMHNTLHELLPSDARHRPTLLMALRAAHLLECEKLPYHGQADLVLEPYKWMRPDTIEEVGELRVLFSRRRGGVVLLSLSAVLDRIARIINRQNEEKQR